MKYLNEYQIFLNESTNVVSWETIKTKCITYVKSVLIAGWDINIYSILAILKLKVFESKSFILSNIAFMQVVLFF